MSGQEKEPAILNPFRLTWRMIIATFKISGYLLVALCEILWYAGNGRKDRIGDTIGDTGRGIVDALADIIRE